MRIPFPHPGTQKNMAFRGAQSYEGIQGVAQPAHLGSQSSTPNRDIPAYDPWQGISPPQNTIMYDMER